MLVDMYVFLGIFPIATARIFFDRNLRNERKAPSSPQSAKVLVNFYHFKYSAFILMRNGGLKNLTCLK